MLVSSAQANGTADAADDSPPQSPAAAVAAPSTEVLITTTQVALSTAAALGAGRESRRVRFVAMVRRMTATPPGASRPHRTSYPMRYGFLEDALMAREMHRL